LRSLYEDLREVLRCKRRAELRRLIELTGEARDAGVLRDLLAACADAREAPSLRRIERALRKRERAGLKRIFRALLRLRIEAS